MTFTRATCRTLQDECLAALAPVLAKHGLTAEGAGGKFDAAQFTMRISFRSADPKIMEDKTKSDWIAYAPSFGLQPEDQGRTFYTSNGSAYTLDSIAPNRPRFPIIAVRDDGKRFKFNPEAVKRALGGRS